MPSYNEQQQRYRARKYSAEFDDILSLIAKENILDDVRNLQRSFWILLTADATTAQADIACAALMRLAAANSTKGALEDHELRGLSVNHGELTQLSGLVNNLISVGLGCVATFAAVVLGDNVLMEKAWQDIGILRAHAHV